MHYEQRPPTNSSLSNYIKYFWWVHNSGDDTIARQKIIPDGYPELIVHFGDPYKINITGKWENQGRLLLAGQITNHFFLENTGSSYMIGIKMQPAAIFELFRIDMSQAVNKVLQIDEKLNSLLFSLLNNMPCDFNQAIRNVENSMMQILENNTPQNHSTRDLINNIIEAKGVATLDESIKNSKVSKRQIERQFLKVVGLPPKLYSRIIRFSYIFNHVNQTKNWSDITHELGFYDQAHFIKNFKEFSGEKPSEYGYDKENLANFFLSSKT